MIIRDHKLPVARQCQILGLARSTAYYQRRSVSAAGLARMRRIDELHLEHPFMGARMLRDQLNREGFDIGRRQAGTMMKRMGMEAIYRKPGTSNKHPGHEIYPYLLRNLTIDRANQVWALDTTCIRRPSALANYLEGISFQNPLLAFSISIPKLNAFITFRRVSSERMFRRCFSQKWIKPIHFSRSPKNGRFMEMCN
ncbi:MAG: IS3 family transposase [Nitrosospira sp.]|nr:IS3 family transposase [Nitrosospira sp.]